MSWTWSIPVDIQPSHVLKPPLLNPDRLRVIVPTFRDWDEARITIDSLLLCRPLPAEVVLVNDNREPEPPAWVRRYPIHLVGYPGNRGPAYARNAGTRLRSDRPIQWFYFTDTGCIRNARFFAILAETSMEIPRTTVAIAGPVRGTVVSPTSTPINSYMTDEAILNPPVDAGGPQAVVTANAAVSAAAFWAVGGFDTSYPFAAGEDLDLGLRLRRFGSIAWAPHAMVYHRFAESLEDFENRFRRYGAGNAHLERQWTLPPMRVHFAETGAATLGPLAKLHFRAMQEGYDRHTMALAERSLRVRQRLVHVGERPLR